MNTATSYPFQKADSVTSWQEQEPVALRGRRRGGLFFRGESGHGAGWILNRLSKPPECLLHEQILVLTLEHFNQLETQTRLLVYI